MTSDRLGIERSDIVTGLMKGVAGVIPFVGQLVGEAIDLRLPNQRIDRLVGFARILSQRVDALGFDLDELRRSLACDEGVEILEEVLVQVSRSPSEQRREYLANLLLKATWSDDFGYRKATVLLRLLNELTDPEVVMLRYGALKEEDAQQDFSRRFEDIVGGINPNTGSRRDVERRAVQDAYIQHLKRLALVEPRAANVMTPTPLGEMLLREILSDQVEDARD